MNESLGQESRIEHFSKVWSSNDPSFLFSPLKLSSLFWGMLIGEGNGNPLQYSCLENPTDGGAWWAAIYGVAQSQTWLKWLSSSSSSRITLKTNSSVQFSSVQFSRSVVSDSLRPHESQHARPPCPSPTPGVHSDSHPSSQWCHPTISSSVVPYSSCPQSLSASESFKHISTDYIIY